MQCSMGKKKKAKKKGGVWGSVAYDCYAILPTGSK